LAALHAAGTCDANLPVFGWFSGGGRFMQWYLAPHGSIIMDNLRKIIFKICKSMPEINSIIFLKNSL